MSGHPNPAVEHTRRRVGGLLEEVALCFKPGVKLTLLVRTPGNDAADFAMTNDDHAEIVKAVERMKTNVTTPPDTDKEPARG